VSIFRVLCIFFSHVEYEKSPSRWEGVGLRENKIIHLRVAVFMASVLVFQENK
jgi:hypothetical protein